MFPSITALRTAVKAAEIAKAAGIFTNRALHITAKPTTASKIKISHARIPQSLKDRASELQQIKAQSKERYPLLMSPEVVKSESAATWEFLKKEAKSNPDAASIVTMIEDFREKKSQIALVENQMPKTSMHQSRVDIVPVINENTMAYGIDTRSFTEIARLVRIIQEHELDLNLVQEFYCRLGFTPFNRLVDPNDTIPLTVGYDVYDQERHKDGYLTKDGTNPLAINTLLPAHISNNPVVSTVFIDDDAVIKILFETNPQAAAILQKPLFITPPSDMPHPILQKDDHGRFNILYSGSIVDEKYTLLKEGDKLINYFEQARDALQKLDQAIAETERSENAFKIVLADQKLLMFHNMLHARTSDIPRGILLPAIKADPRNPKQIAQGRILISLSGKKLSSEEKGPAITK